MERRRGIGLTGIMAFLLLIVIVAVVIIVIMIIGNNTGTEVLH